MSIKTIGAMAMAPYHIIQLSKNSLRFRQTIKIGIIAEI